MSSLSDFQKYLNYPAIQTVLAQRSLWLQQPDLHLLREAVNLAHSFQPSIIDLSQDVITFGRAEDLTHSQHELLLKVLKTFVPWRKGPFNIFGTPIDAEWRSELKWNRVLKVLKPLTGRRIADIGCNNGYYLFRMASQNPEYALGIEPTIRFYHLFQMLQAIAKVPNIEVELLGIEHMPFFSKFFDVVLCMGILYHHPDPVGLLKGIWGSMRYGGQLIVECAGIPGEESVALFPERRYAQMSGSWFFPTQSCLVNWIKRAGFKKVTVFDSHPLGPEEQRQTPWSPHVSLQDF